MGKIRIRERGRLWTRHLQLKIRTSFAVDIYTITGQPRFDAKTGYPHIVSIIELLGSIMSGIERFVS
jgi:hypothetical protein